MLDTGLGSLEEEVSDTYGGSLGKFGAQGSLECSLEE